MSAVPVKKLFIAHSSRNAEEVHALADELRLRGIVPWVDKQGGLKVGDHSEAEVRRAIREDCFGVLLYASRVAFDSAFVRDVELPEAQSVKTLDPDFLLLAIPVGIGFEELRVLSRSRYGIDLSVYNSVPVETAALPASLAHVASEVGARFLKDRLKRGVSRIDLQFSTRDLMPDEESDLLRIDGTRLVGKDPCSHTSWARVTSGLKDVKADFASLSGRPRLRIHGSKHLTGAFILGRVFAQSDIEIRQTPLDYWTTDMVAEKASPLGFVVDRSETGAPVLFLEVCSGIKNVRGGVDSLIRRQGIAPRLRLRLNPGQPLLLDNRLCRQIADQTCDTLQYLMATADFLPEEVHIFAAVPQTMMVMLGKSLRGLPPVVLYEWRGSEYCPSCRLEAGVL